MKMKISKEKKKELNKLVDDRSLTPAETEKARKAINTVVKEIKKAMASMEDITVDRVFKGGAWKKGTMVREEKEVELVVFIDSDNYYQFEADVQRVLLTIGNHMMELSHVHMLRESAYSLTIRYKIVHVTIMVGYNKAKNGADNSVKDQRDECMRILEEEVTLDVSTALCLSPSFSETICSLLQSRIAESDHILARAIKLMKHWNKCHFEQDTSHKTQLSGYALEVLMTYLYDKHKSHASAPRLFCSALELIANLGTETVDVALSDFVIIASSVSTRPLRIFDPCLANDIIEDFESWRALICVAKKTLKQIQDDTPFDRVFYSQKKGKSRRSQSPETQSSDDSTQQTVEKLISEITPQAPVTIKIPEIVQQITESINVTTQYQEDTIGLINSNVEKLVTDLSSLSSSVAEHKYISNIFYHKFLDDEKFPKTLFTCQRHGGVVAQVQVVGDIVIVEGGSEHGTCDLWATPTGLDKWNTTPEGAKPLFPLKLDFKVGAKSETKEEKEMQAREGEEGAGVCLSVQEEGMRVQKSNPAKCGKWVVYYSKSRPGIAGMI